MGLDTVTCVSLFYGVAWSIGLADLRWKVDLVERTFRNGKGNHNPVEALELDADRPVGLALLAVR